MGEIKKEVAAIVTPPMVSIFEKIQRVSMEVMNLEKDMQIGKGNYAYKAVSDTQVTLAVKRAEEKHGINSVPVKQELVSSEVLKKLNKDGSESFVFVDNVKLTLRIFDLESGESIEIESFGKGIDSGDKGFGKASTYARKYALLNAYKITTGEDPDANKSEEHKQPKTISEKRKAVVDFLNLDTERLNRATEHFGVAKVDDLTDDNINIMYTSYKAKKLI